MSSRSYWREREAEVLQQRIADEEEYDKKIVEIYRDMLDATQKEIEAFYGKYADKEGITIADAKKRVSKVDIEAYERKAQRYVEAADRDRKTKGETDPDAEYFSETADEEMRLYNLTMKVNRLELLKANIGLELVKGHVELESYMGEILQGRTMDELERQAGILGQTIKSNAKKVHAIVNASFHNATYSDRIWMHQDLLKNDLAKLLQSGLIQGKNPRELARELKKKFDVKASDAERLMRTELARVQTEAQKQSFERNDYEEYEFIVNSNCCPICAALDGKHFKVEDMMPGKNAPPMHPNCRCSIAAYEDSEEYEAWLDYLDKGGTTEEWKKLKDKIVEKSSESSVNVLEKNIVESTMEVPGNLQKYDRKARIYTRNEDAKAVNPNYNKGAEYRQNCQRCVPAYELRRRGYDVTAKPARVTAKGALSTKDSVVQNSGWRNDIFENIKWKIGNAGSGLNDIEKAMKSFGDGARAEVYVHWKKGGGHVFVAEQVGDTTVFIDPQTGADDVRHYFEDVRYGSTMFARIDNKPVKDLIDECVQNGR